MIILTALFEFIIILSTFVHKTLCAPPYERYDLRQTTNHVTAEGNPLESDQVAFTIVSLLCMFGLGLAFGNRLRHLTRESLSKITFIRALVLVLYFLSFSFILSAAIVEPGLRRSSHRICSAAIYICLTFYYTSKGVIQLFLTERAHAVRKHHRQRYKDYVWVACITIIIAGFGGITVLSFIHPIAYISPDDTVCKLGDPVHLLIPMLAYDTIFQIVLTTIFVVLLKRPSCIIAGKHSKHPEQRIDSFGLTFARSDQNCSATDDMTLRPTGTVQAGKAVRWQDKLVFRSLIGSILMLVGTVANLGVLLHQGGREVGWVCLTLCTIDVTWAVFVLHWLTMNPEPEKQPICGDDGSVLGLMG